jgi:hypothetical protein
MYLKEIAAGAAMIGALGFSALGLGAGTASAAPPAPAVAGWQLDGHGGYWDHDGNGGDWGHRGDWDNRRGWDNGPGWGCVTGPFGHITWCP